MTKFQRRAFQAFLFLLVFGVLAILAVRVGARWYLENDSFRQQITRAVNQELKADGAFMPLHFGDGTFFSDGFVARGTPRAFFSELRADQIRAVVDWHGLLRRRWQIDELKVENLDLRFAGRSPKETTPVKNRPPRPPRKAGWKLDLRKAEVAQSSWHWGMSEATAGNITKSRFTLTPSEGGWLIEATGGKISQTGWPLLSIESADLRYTGSSLFLTESALRAGDGRIQVAGEIQFDRAADFQADLAGVDLTPLLARDWRMRLHGKLAGTVRVHAPLPEGAMQITGDLRLVDGQLEALPLLDQVATFTRTDRFRHVALTRGELSFTRIGENISVKNLLVESGGLMRVEGSCSITHNRIDGLFQVGVTSASLQWLPGSQTRVFTVARDGYYWTPVRLSGPASHPHEDLTKRLVAAAAGELLENPEQTLRDAAKTLLDLIPH